MQFTQRHNLFAIYALTGQGAALAGRIALALQKTSGHFAGQIFLSAKIATHAMQHGGQQHSGAFSFSYIAVPPACPDINPQNPDSLQNFNPQNFDRLADCLAANFHAFSCHILICASGIAVRCLAPLLVSKQSDPAVLLLDQGGRFVISLLSGHLGQANLLATEIAALISGTPVITTATDSEGLPAIDSLAAEKGLWIVNPAAVRSVSAALLRGERPLLHDPQNLLGLLDSPAGEYFQFVNNFNELQSALCNPVDESKNIVLVNVPVPSGRIWENWANADASRQILRLESRSIWLGLGCKRGTDIDKLEAFALSVLEEQCLTPGALAGLASLDRKQDEPALLELAGRWRLPLRFFSADELEKVPGARQSERVRQAVGCGSVCEAAALLAAANQSFTPSDEHAIPQSGGYALTSPDGQTARLIMAKRKGNGMTAALAKNAEHP